jgi:hypothetical protein
MIIEAAAQGRDVNKLLTDAVTCRRFEDDPTDPANRVAGVLHYRIKARLAHSDLPEEADSTLAQAMAPPAARPPGTVRDEQKPARTISQSRTDERSTR